MVGRQGTAGNLSASCEPPALKALQLPVGFTALEGMSQPVPYWNSSCLPTTSQLERAKDQQSQVSQHWKYPDSLWPGQATSNGCAIFVSSCFIQCCLLVDSLSKSHRADSVGFGVFWGGVMGIFFFFLNKQTKKSPNPIPPTFILASLPFLVVQGRSLNPLHIALQFPHHYNIKEPVYHFSLPLPTKIIMFGQSSLNTYK